MDHIATAPGLVCFSRLPIRPCAPKLLDTLRQPVDGMCLDVLEGTGDRPARFPRYIGDPQGRPPASGRPARYLERIEVLNFTIAHDDGQSLDTVSDAQVILTGASRTSKTPTCVYLAIRGVKAANIPLVPGVPPPSALLAARKPLIVGLWVSPERLVQVRRNRLASMGEGRDTNYIDPDLVREEINVTRRLFEQNEWPSIDVSRRSIEETAAAVINLMAERREPAAS